MNPTNGQLVKNKKQQKQFFTSENKKSKTKKRQKKHLNIAPYFRQLPLLFEWQNTEFSFQVNSLMILSINKNRGNLRNNEFSLYQKSE